MSDDREPPEGLEIWQVHIYNPEEPEVVSHAEVEVEDPEPEFSMSAREGLEKRVLVLSEGGDLFDGEPSGLHTIVGGQNLQRNIITDRPTAIGYFLHGLETHGIPEEATMLLEEQMDISPYHEWQRSLTSRDRKIHLLDLLEARIADGDWAAEPYQDRGTWRSTGLSESGEKLARRITRDIEPEARMCYYSAGEAAIHEIDNHRVEYAEGICLPTQAGQAIRHAWLEIDGEVAEITWPWHQFDGADAEYFGIAIDKERVKERRESGEQNGAIVLSPEETKQVSAAMRGEN